MAAEKINKIKKLVNKIGKRRMGKMGFLRLWAGDAQWEQGRKAPGRASWMKFGRGRNDKQKSTGDRSVSRRIVIGRVNI